MRKIKLLPGTPWSRAVFFRKTEFGMYLLFEENGDLGAFIALTPGMRPRFMALIREPRYEESDTE